MSEQICIDYAITRTDFEKKNTIRVTQNQIEILQDGERATVFVFPFFDVAVPVWRTQRNAIRRLCKVLKIAAAIASHSPSGSEEKFAEIREEIVWLLHLESAMHYEIGLTVWSGRENGCVRLLFSGPDEGTGEVASLLFDLNFGEADRIADVLRFAMACQYSEADA